jgi:hypothetical protein
MTIPESNAAQAAFFQRNPIRPAWPTWEDLTPHERDHERSLGSASEFEEFFEFGYCRTEGTDGAIIGEDGFCVWCGGEIDRSIEPTELTEGAS